jgi:hypothetical protein
MLMLPQLMQPQPMLLQQMLLQPKKLLQLIQLKLKKPNQNEL